MTSITTAGLSTLLDATPGPCVSVYMPTERSYPANQQGPIRYRNLLGRADEMLRQKYPGSQVRALLARFNALLDDPLFWTHQRGGLAVLGSPAAFHDFELERPVPERVVVNDSYHVKPLLRIAQSADRYQVLSLQRDNVRLYAGNRDGLEEIRPQGVPLTVTEALGEAVQVQRKEQVQGGKSGGEPRPAPNAHGDRVGHPRTNDEAKLDAERFFRAIDRAVWERVSRPSGLPLVLAGLPEQVAQFRSVSHNHQVLPQAVEQGPGLMPVEQLRQAAWKCVEPRYLERLAQFSDDFQVARARGLGSAEVAEVARAAHGGRVGILLVEAERTVPGRIDPQTGEATFVTADGPDVDDLLDDIAERALRAKGTVVVVPRERMPSDTGIAAVFRF